MGVKCVNGVMIHPPLPQATPYRCGVHEETGKDREHRPCDRQSRYAHSGGAARVQAEGEVSVIHTCAHNCTHIYDMQRHNQITPLYFPPTHKIFSIIEVMNMDDLLL